MTHGEISLGSLNSDCRQTKIVPSGFFGSAIYGFPVDRFLLSSRLAHPWLSDALRAYDPGSSEPNCCLTHHRKNAHLSCASSIRQYVSLR